MGSYKGRDFYLGCTPPKTTINFSGLQPFFGSTQGTEVELDDVVDHLLLKGEIEIEVSL
jgi:hypothetical protein